MWMVMAATVGVLLIISMWFVYFNRNPYNLFDLRNLYLVVFMVGGYIFTSKVFDEMHAPQKSYMFLTLPVSAPEKLLAAWLITSPVYVVVFGLLMLLLSFFSSAAGGNLDVLPHLFDNQFFNCIKVYLVTQAVFLLGATAFRGNNFLKTLLALILAAFAIAAYAGGLGYLLFWDGTHQVRLGGEQRDITEYIFTKGIPMLFWWLLAPFLLLVSYFKLKERQV